MTDRQANLQTYACQNCGRVGNAKDFHTHLDCLVVKYRNQRLDHHDIKSLFSYAESGEAAMRHGSSHDEALVQLRRERQGRIHV